MLTTRFEPHTVVFHPGIGKTATTAIQQIGLALPVSDGDRACFSPVGVLGGAHNAYASNHPMYRHDDYRPSVEALVDFVGQRSAPTVVSSEFLMREPEERIADLIGTLAAADIRMKALFAIRAYEPFLLSAYMQALKADWGMRENETLEQYARRELPLIRYPALIDPWARRIGDDNVFLIDYDHNRADMIGLFFGFLGLSPELLPERSETANPSLPLVAMEVVRSFDAVCGDKEARTRLVELLMRLRYRPGGDATYREVVRRVTGDRYVEDCARLSARYTWIGETP